MSNQASWGFFFCHSSSPFHSSPFQRLYSLSCGSGKPGLTDPNQAQILGGGGGGGGGGGKCTVDWTMDWTMDWNMDSYSRLKQHSSTWKNRVGGGGGGGGGARGHDAPTNINQNDLCYLFQLKLHECALSMHNAHAKKMSEGTWSIFQSIVQKPAFTLTPVPGITLGDPTQPQAICIRKRKIPELRGGGSHTPLDPLLLTYNAPDHRHSTWFGHYLLYMHM